MCIGIACSLFLWYNPILVGRNSNVKIKFGYLTQTLYLCILNEV